MMRQINILIVTILFVQHSLAQRYPFQWVNVPDSISDILNKNYQSADVGAGKNVYKMMVFDDFEFEDGMYSYKGMGPHFPLRLFILNNNNLYVFLSSSHKPSEYIAEWNSYLKKHEMEDERVIDYSVAILDYLIRENDIDTSVFPDSILSDINIKSNESDYIRAQICLRLKNIESDFPVPSKPVYPSVKIDLDNLYGQWYFQTIIHKRHVEDGDELTQETCEEMPLIYLNPDNNGIFYINGERHSFYWSYNKNKIRIGNISKIFFKKRKTTLLIKNMFRHNHKVFMELEDGRGDIYVLSHHN